MQRNQLIAAVVAAILVVAVVALLIVKPWKGASETATVDDPAALVANDRVVARVNGTDIRLADVALAEEEMGQALAQIPEQVRFQYLLSLLIDRRVISIAAKKENTQNDPLVKTRATYYAEKALRDVYWVRSLQKVVTDEKVQAFYQANYVNQKEVRAAHILVTTKEEAQKILEELNAGKNFAELAKANSKDGSAKNGGELDWYKKIDLVSEIGNTIFSMKPGETSAEPVQSRFGWHIFRLFEFRDGATPAFDDVRPAIMRTVARDEGEALLTSWREKNKIEIVKEDGTSEVVSANEPDAVPAPATTEGAPEAAPAEEAPAAEAPAEEAPAPEGQPAAE